MTTKPSAIVRWTWQLEANMHHGSTHFTDATLAQVGEFVELYPDLDAIYVLEPGDGLLVGTPEGRIIWWTKWRRGIPGPPVAIEPRT